LSSGIGGEGRTTGAASALNRTALKTTASVSSEESSVGKNATAPTVKIVKICDFDICTIHIQLSSIDFIKNRQRREDRTSVNVFRGVGKLLLLGVRWRRISTLFV
jgi:hypothetical protein